MKNIKNIKFTKQLVQSDFLFVRHSRVQSSETIKTQFSESRLGAFLVLDAFEVNRSLKQLIRSVSFLSSQPQYRIYIWVAEKHNHGFLSQIISHFSMDGIIKISQQFPEPDSSTSLCSLMLIFGTPYNLSNKKVNSLALTKNIFMVNRINLKKDKLDLGTYKIKNIFDDYKKLIFLLVLINKILKR